MAKFMQIIDVIETGQETVLHPETNADYVTTGTTYRVPKIADITDWTNRSKELIDARKGEESLLDKINSIDTALRADNLLLKIKSVDGAGSGLDADLLDGRTVDDNALDTNTLWTSLKTNTEINKKISLTEAVASPTPFKILKMDKNGHLPTDITGNAISADRFKNPITVNFTGAVQGNVKLTGNGETRDVNLTIADNSHEHNKLEGDTNVYSNVKDTDADLFLFQAGGTTKAIIDNEGNFSGGADNIGGYKVNNYDENSIWTGEKVQSAIEEELQTYASRGDGDTISLGPITYMSGEVSITGLGTVTINPPLPINEKIISESYVLTSSDKTMTFVKDPGSDNSSITLNFNKLGPLNAKINWYITAI